MKKLLSTTLLLTGLAFAQASSAVTFDFAEYAETYGEAGYAWGEFAKTESGLTVYAEGAVNFDPVQWANDPSYIPGEAFAYLDEKIGNGLPAGLGVCKIVDQDLECAPNSDDNLSYGEALGLWFTDANDNAVEVTIEEMLFRNAEHGDTFGANDTFWIMVDGVATEYSLTHVFTTALTGSEFIFWVGQEGTELYLSALTVAESVPAPAPLALLALGLLGIYTTSRKKKIAA